MQLTTDLSLTAPRRRAQSSGGFTPNTILGLLAGWYEAQGYDAATGTLTDKGLAGNHAAQATPAARPAYLADAGGGLPAVRFDGVDDHLENSAGWTFGAMTFAVVAKVLSSNNGQDSLFSMRKLGSNTDYQFDASSGQAFYARFLTGDMLPAAASRPEPVVDYTGQRTCFVVVVDVDTGTLRMRMNGVERLVDTTLSTGTYPVETFALGANRVQSQFLSFDFHEGLILATVDPATIADVEGYLMARWGIAA